MQFGTVVSERRQILSLVHDDGWWGRVSLNPLHANISIHVLHTALFTFPINMTRRIYWNIFIFNYDLYLHYTPQELKNWTISNTSVYLRLHDMKCCWTANNRVFFFFFFFCITCNKDTLFLLVVDSYFSLHNWITIKVTCSRYMRVWDQNKMRKLEAGLHLYLAFSMLKPA